MNPESKVAIRASHETLFFSRHNGQLCQWINVQIENPASDVLPAVVTIQAGGMQARTALDLEPGLHDYRCFAPTLFPAHPPEPAADLLLEIGKQAIRSQISVGSQRPWTVYLLADVCTDATWVYDRFEPMVRDDAELTAAEIHLAEQTRDQPLPNRNHYNLVHAREIEYFLSTFPDQEERLVEALRNGEIQLNPFYTMMNTGAVSLEELIRHFYPARNFALRHGLDYTYANHQETPSITWGMAMVLAGSGIRRLVKAILPYECPWVSRSQEPPLYIWQGPDGSQVYMRKRNKDYVEGSFVLKGLAETNRVLHEQILPAYQAYGERYPFDAISVLGVYGDLIPEGGGKYWADANPELGPNPQSKDLAPFKVKTVIEYNSQGWEYPRLVNASHKQFWDDIERQISARQLNLAVLRGDFGHGWDAWTACLAGETAGWRQAQEKAQAADFVAAILSLVSPQAAQELRQALDAGWNHLRYLSDHAWNGANDANRLLNQTLRRNWQLSANMNFDIALQQGLTELASQIPSGGEDRQAVINPLGWERSGLVHLPHIDGPRQVVDVASGKTVPSQWVDHGVDKGLCFHAAGLPPAGYRVFTVGRGAAEQETGEFPWKFAGNRLEGKHYAIEVSPATGGIARLYDKIHGRELIDPESPYHLNQLVYWREGIEYSPTQATIQPGPAGACFAQVIVETSVLTVRCKTTYTLYQHSDRIDICNELDKEPSSEKQELDFVFPFNLPHCEAVYEAPGALIRPGLDHLPGAGHNVYPVRHFVDIYNAEYGITLSQRDSFLVEFGHRTTLEDPAQPDLSNGTLFIPVIENVIDSQECIRDQGGYRHFKFRFSLRCHGGGFDPLQAIRFGYESCSDPLTVPLKGDDRAPLPQGEHSFIQVHPDHALLAYLKLAEEDGVIARIWECQGSDTMATLTLPAPHKLHAAQATDLLEINQGSLAVSDNRAQLPVKARSLASVRLKAG